MYDLILENKVKSIPYKEQLKKYEDKIKEENNPVYLLLSLVSKFPDERNVAPWVIVHYDKLKRAIESQKED